MLGSIVTTKTEVSLFLTIYLSPFFLLYLTINILLCKQFVKYFNNFNLKWVTFLNCAQYFSDSKPLVYLIQKPLLSKLATYGKYQIILTDFWVLHEIESCNFQNLLVFRFPDTSQNLISFWQLLFSIFQKGDPSKKCKTQKKSNKMTLPCGQDDLVLSFCHSFRRLWDLL